PAVAQSYPERPVRIVIPFAAGGPNDLIGRPLAEKMSEALGQPFVIENKGGAAGSLGTQFVAKASPDGYTLLMTTGSFTGNVAISANPTYNPVADFAPVTLLAQSYGIVLMTRPDFPAKTLTEFVALAKKYPGKYSYGHAGIGNVTFMAAELFQKLAGIELLKVPYRGTASFAPDIMSGHVSVGFMSTVIAQPNLQGGQLRALGISGSQRAPILPDVPTFQELGFKEMDVTGYFGLWFPAATPRERVALIHREAVKALQTPLLKKVLADSGVRAIGSTPGEFARFLDDDMRWQVDIIKRIGLQPQ
ncbi:MAG: Bug family tripartite tricarboxylate transporter substrate binding protein, partial [Burkholderiales bacterium]